MIPNNSEIRLIKEKDYPMWDEFVTISPQGTIFHSSDWLNLSAKYFKKNLKIFGYFMDDELSGGCPIFIENKKGIFKIASSHCALSPFGGFLFKQFQSSKVRNIEKDQYNILEGLCNAILEEKFILINIINCPDLRDIRPFIWNGWQSRVYYTYYINKSQFDKDAFSWNSIRKDIHRAQRNNIKIREDLDSDLHYRLFSNVFEKQNLTPPVNKSFFDGVISLIKNQKIFGNMWVAELETGERVHSEIFLRDRKRAYEWSIGSNYENVNTGARVFSFFKILQELKEMNIEEINIMQANIPRLSHFASSFNPSLVPYFGIERDSLRYRLLHYLIK